MLRILSEKVCGRLVPGRHPRVSQDLLGCQSSGWVDVQHLCHDVLGQAGHSGPVARAHVVLTLPNPLQDVLGGVLGPRGEGRLPRQHREEKDTQAPDVTRSIVTLTIKSLLRREHYCLVGADLLLEDLWGHIIGGVARGHQHAVIGPQLFGKSKVTDSDGVWVTRVISIENIRGLQIPKLLLLR